MEPRVGGRWYPDVQRLSPLGRQGIDERSGAGGHRRTTRHAECKEVHGEGLMSLTRAFMYAGTPSVVVSLWNVNDQSAADLMIRFYRNLQTGMTKGEALRQAQLETIRDNGFPFFWAPFVLIGRS